MSLFDMDAVRHQIDVLTADPDFDMTRSEVVSLALAMFLEGAAAALQASVMEPELHSWGRRRDAVVELRTAQDEFLKAVDS